MKSNTNLFLFWLARAACRLSCVPALCSCGKQNHKRKKYVGVVVGCMIHYSLFFLIRVMENGKMEKDRRRRTAPSILLLSRATRKPANCILQTSNRCWITG